jgi:hypothetical protein
MKEASSSSETSLLTRATRRNIPEDTILHFVATAVSSLAETQASSVLVPPADGSRMYCKRNSPVYCPANGKNHVTV